MSRRGEKLDEPGIYRLDDGRYRILATAKDPDKGEMVPRQKTMPAGATLEEAIAERDRIKEQISAPTIPKEDVVRLRHYATQWLTDKKPGLSPSSYNSLSGDLGNHVLPIKVVVDGERMELKDVPLRDLTTQHVKQWVGWASSARQPNDKLYADRTVKRWFRNFRHMICDMAAHGYIEKDISHRVDPPSTGRTDVRKKPVYYWYELKAIMDVAKDVAPERYAEIAILCRTGMRSGELWALKWADIDLVLGEMHVHRGVSDGKIVDRTKTSRDRVVPMLDPIGPAIREHKETVDSGADDLVFPSTNGTPRQPGSLRAAFRNVQSELRLDLKPGPQLIRQSVGTFLEDNPDVSESTIDKFLGNTKEVRRQHYHRPNASTRERLRVLEGGKAV